MFGKRIHLFTLLGFAIWIDLSWFFLAVIVTWSLATSVFPAWYRGLPSLVYLSMGLMGTVGLFFSIVLHEVSHSVIARRHGVVMRGITLFIFGGVAEMTEEPPSPKAEFQVAVAGPLASVVIALVTGGIASLGAAFHWAEAVTGVFRYLSFINIALVVFNLIPAFPLDGGRVLRALLWRRKRTLIEATRITSRIGIGFSFVLIGAGVLAAVSGNLIGGVWYFLIGMFLRGAATMSYQQLVVRRSLEGEKVSRFMQANPVTVPADIPLSTLVEDYIYRHHYKMFPVMDHGNLVGCITTRHIRNIAREDWPRRTVGEIAEPCSPENTIGAKAGAIQALTQMSRLGISRLMVVEDGRLAGIITLKDMLQFLALKTELEG